MKHLLEGVRVVELANYAAGPGAGSVLADLGADVIHIEDPKRGDPFRHPALSHRYMRTSDDEFSLTWEAINHNKRSLAISLKHPEGREVLHKLVARSDVFITNFISTKLKAFGADYPVLSDINARLIYARITSYGSRGPLKDRPAYDYGAYWAASGIMDTFGKVLGVPPTSRPGMGDRMTGIIAAGMIGLALYNAARTGKGQLAEVSLMNIGMCLIGTDLQSTANPGNGSVPLVNRTEAPNPIWNSYQTGDGKWIMLTMPLDFEWKHFCRAIEGHDLVSDSRFNTTDARTKNSKQLIAIFDRIFATKKRDEWEQRFEKEGLIWATVNSLDEVINHPQVGANEWYFHTQHPKSGNYQFMRSPMYFEQTPSIYRKRAPKLGEHNEEILRELGYSPGDLARLCSKGTIK